MTKKIQFNTLANYCDTAEKHKDEIIKQWTKADEVMELFEDFNIDADFFIKEFGEPIYLYLLNVVRDKARIGDCPNIRRLIAYLSTKEIGISDIYVLCSSLRLSFFDFLTSEAETFEPLQTRLIREMMQLFDRNLTGVFGSYSSSVHEQRQMVKAQQISLYENTELLNQYKNAIDESAIVSKADKEGIITYVNDHFCQISGYTRSELIGKSHNIIRHPDMPKNLFRKMWNKLLNKEVWHGIIKNRCKDGGEYYVDTTIVPIFDDKGTIKEFISIRFDITNLVQIKGEKLKYELLSSIDSLTNITNRLKFDKKFSVELEKANRYNSNLALIIFDIDNFKQINDNYGHQTGDKVIKLIAKKVSENVRRLDTFARWGGEEFVVLTHTNGEHAIALAEKLRILIEECQCSEIKAKITCSFGVATFRQDDDVDSMLLRADNALYAAKRNGKNRVEFEG